MSPAQPQLFCGGEDGDAGTGNGDGEVIGHRAQVDDGIALDVAEAVLTKIRGKIIGIRSGHAVKRVAAVTAGNLVSRAAAGYAVVAAVAVEFVFSCTAGNTVVVIATPDKDRAGGPGSVQGILASVAD